MLKFQQFDESRNNSSGNNFVNRWIWFFKKKRTTDLDENLSSRFVFSNLWTIIFEIESLRRAFVEDHHRIMQRPFDSWWPVHLFRPALFPFRKRQMATLFQVHSYSLNFVVWTTENDEILSIKTFEINEFTCSSLFCFRRLMFKSSRRLRNSSLSKPRCL